MNEKNELNEDEVFEKEESKFKFLANKKILGCIISIIIIAALIILEFTTQFFSTICYGLKNSTGNTIGNISNGGYAVAKDDYIYYVAPSENMQTTNIYKVKNNSTDSQLIFEGGYDIRALNVLGNKLYFISLAYSDGATDDVIDNKICRMNLDGSNIEVINDNEFNDNFYQLYVIKNKVYYVGTDENVYKMDLNGSNRELVAETGTGYLAINSKYIIYNKSNEDDSDYITYIKNLKTNEEHEIINGRVSTPDIYEDYIYYINSKQCIARVPINGGDEEVLLDDSAYNMNIYNGNIYYLGYKGEDYTVCIYKLSVNGGEPEIVKEFSYYTSFIEIVNNCVYYMDMDDQKAFISLVDINDPNNELNLYEWPYEDQEAGLNIEEDSSEQ